MHLYIHVPFCHRICPYCAFFKHTPGRSDIRGYAQAVGTEARLRLPQGTAPRTIYFGGGTPSMLSPTHLKLLVDGTAGLAAESGMSVEAFRAWLEKINAEGIRKEDVMNHFWEIDNKPVEDTLFWEEAQVNLAQMKSTEG